MRRSALACFISLAFFHICLASEKCVIAYGHLVCNKNPQEASMAELKIYDKDAPWPLNWFDPDDLMVYGLPNSNGDFKLAGCARDTDPLPGIKNHPDPFLVILHKCNKKEGEMLRYNGTLHFSPLRSNLGDIVLDSR
ncbi:unnamed protein product [Soboliphyme baturini]|uniref:Transthyretin-like family protein n=1 Tax=Soboliphyme baturini TaxID=241478 RepID=A0A183J7I3_9BILA|nr:unnamed protein product [Soboliphyme baturini]